MTCYTFTCQSCTCTGWNTNSREGKNLVTILKFENEKLDSCSAFPHLTYNQYLPRWSDMKIEKRIQLIQCKNLCLFQFTSCWHYHEIQCQFEKKSMRMNWSAVAEAVDEIRVLTDQEVNHQFKHLDYRRISNNYSDRKQDNAKIQWVIDFMKQSAPGRIWSNNEHGRIKRNEQLSRLMCHLKFKISNYYWELLRTIWTQSQSIYCISSSIQPSLTNHQSFIQVQ